MICEQGVDAGAEGQGNLLRDRPGLVGEQLQAGARSTHRVGVYFPFFILHIKWGHLKKRLERKYGNHTVVVGGYRKKEANGVTAKK
jgi:hypothetical protein